MEARPAFDPGTTRVMIFASALIVFSMLLIGAFVYSITQQEVVKRVKERDLVALAEGISARVDGRIGKAVETSLALAHDPALEEWLSGGETDDRLRRTVMARIRYLHEALDYSTVFIAGAQTRHYWTHDGAVIDTISGSDPADGWFFDALASGREAAVNFDYNKELQDTFAFVNALAGPPGRPVGIVGVGMSLHELSRDFASYKDGSGISLWLVNEAGTIFLSDRYESNGRNIRDVMGGQAAAKLLAGYAEGTRVIDYKNEAGERMDLIGYPLRSTDLQLLVQIERSESVAFLRTIRLNTILAVAVSVVAIVFFFFYVSRKLANPYKQAIALNRELERQVEARTRELAERNAQMLDSISYAKLLQESVLPKETQLRSLLAGQFVIWRPRDVVGGDFYWVKRTGGRTLVAVGDCTGHGVPGAFMTLLAISALDRIADSLPASAAAPTEALTAADGQAPSADPAAILGRLNRLMKDMLRQNEADGDTDDGLDIGLCVEEDGRLTFAGAGLALYRLDAGGLRTYAGDRRSIGYRRTPAEYAYTNHDVPAGHARYYLATDGFFDQNGGERDYAFGKKRFAELIARCGALRPEEQRAAFEAALDGYRGGERQRDDITVLSFEAAPEATGGIGGERQSDL